jgi:hypothetical protein
MGDFQERTVDRQTGVTGQTTNRYQFAFAHRDPDGTLLDDFRVGSPNGPVRMHFSTNVVLSDDEERALIKLLEFQLSRLAISNGLV